MQATIQDLDVRGQGLLILCSLQKVSLAPKGSGEGAGDQGAARAESWRWQPSSRLQQGAFCCSMLLVLLFSCIALTFRFLYTTKKISESHLCTSRLTYPPALCDMARARLKIAASRSTGRQVKGRAKADCPPAPAPATSFVPVLRPDPFRDHQQRQRSNVFALMLSSYRSFILTIPRA